MKRQLPDHHRTTTPRRGSTFIVVLALLALLAILGLAFVTFTSAEKESAEYFVATSNRQVAPQINTEDTIEFGVRQLILGARNDQVNSALWGGRHSLLAGMFGNDLNPHSGEGIHLTIDLSGQVIVDQNFDGDQDANSSPLRLINDSPVISGGWVPAIMRQLQLPAPDAGYTYPDINNVFLSWQGMALYYETSLPANVILPSFHRPQLLRDASNLPVPYWEVDPNSGGNVLRPHLSHRHVLSNGIVSSDKRFISSTDVFPATGEPLAEWARLSGPFPWNTGEDQNGVWTLSVSPVRPGQWGRTVNSSGLDTFYRLDANGNQVLDSNGNPVTQTFAPTYSFDADADGDGIKEAVWLDLDHPVRVLADGRKVIPLFAFTVRDAGGLVNVNTAGNSVNIGTDGRIGQLASASQFNLNEDTNGNGVLDTGEDVNITNELLDISFISRSNLGMTPAEVNPQWVLNAHPQLDKPSDRTPQELFQQHAYPANQFNSAPVNRVHASNMEWWFALYGAVDSNSGVYYHGREGNLTQNNQSWGAGVFGVDDNLNQFEGRAALGQLRSFTHPLDFRGTGRFIVNAKDSADPSDTSLKWRVNMDTNNFNRYSTYEGYQGSVRWTSSTIPNLTWYRDDSTETIFDHRYRQNSDTIFSADENYFLQASNSDIELSPAESRLAHLMPYNLRDNVRAEQIRRNLTTDSWDLKTPSRRINQRRKGELPEGRFPTSLKDVLRPEVYDLLRQTAELSVPIPGVTDGPVAPVRFQQDWQTYNPVTDYYTRQYRLSVNHLLEYGTEDVNNNGQLDPGEDLNGNGVVDLVLVMRPLRPYPVPSDPNAVALRARAHSDRQKLARDIYTLLYLYGGGRDDLFDATNEDVNNNGQLDPGEDLNGNGVLDLGGVLQSNALTTNNGRPYHTIIRLREMAQFAVNLVDSLDRDDVITKFEYDKNFYNEDLNGNNTLDQGEDVNGNSVLDKGWDLDDNAFTPAIPGSGVEGGAVLVVGDPEYTREFPDDTLTRGVVFGAERQKLTLSEFLAVRSLRVVQNGIDIDHKATAYNDDQDHVFAYVELENASAFNVSLGDDHWRIVFQPNDYTPGLHDDCRILTFVDNDNNTSTPLPTGFSVAPGNKRSIAVRGDIVDKTTQYNGKLYGSAFAVDQDNTTYTTAPPGMAGMADYPFIIPPVNSHIDYNLGRNGYKLFDLLNPHSSGNGFSVTDINGNILDPEHLLSDLPTCFPNVAMTPGTVSVCIVLQRRLDVTSTDPPANNPWVEVDRIEYVRELGDWEFEIEANAAPNYDMFYNQLRTLQSRERREPLLRGGEYFNSMPIAIPPEDGDPTYRANSLVYNNENQRVRQVVHRQLDRDFASVGELLTLPLYGPQEITRSLQYAGSRPMDQYETSINLTPEPAIRSFIAANRFLRPDHPSRQFNASPNYPPTSLTPLPPSLLTPPDGPITKWDNRWSRLFEFVEVPSRNERFSINQDYLPANRRHRVAGKINLNTIRDPDVLAALLDEQHAVQRNRSSLAGHFLVDQFARHRDRKRDWWRQFMLSRDNRDAATGFFLPGVPGSRPFRSPGFVAAGSTSIQHTILRSLPHYGQLSGDTNGDGVLSGSEAQTDPSGEVMFFLGGTDRKRLFELGVEEDLNGNDIEDNDENLDPNGFFNPDIDPVARHHLLSKIMTNSTVRSHVFHVFLKVEWFEAYQGPSPNNSSQTVTMIGAKATDVPSRRAFFVIDRSRAIEQATSIDVLPPLFEDPNGNGILDSGEDLNGNGIIDPERGFNFADARRPFNIAPLILHQRIIE